MIIDQEFYFVLTVNRVGKLKAWRARMVHEKGAKGLGPRGRGEDSLLCILYNLVCYSESNIHSLHSHKESWKKSRRRVIQKR